MTNAAKAPVAPDENEKEHADVGAQLRQAARGRGLSVRRLSVLSRVPRASVEGAFEGADIRLSTLRRLMKVLEITSLHIGSGTIEMDAADETPMRVALAAIEAAEGDLARRKLKLKQHVDEAESRRRLAQLVSDIARDALSK